MARPNPIYETGDDVWSFETDWKEKAGGVRPGGSGVFSSRASTDVLTIEVPMHKLRSCLQNILGFSIADTAPSGSGSSAGWRLHRPKVQMQHPYFSWLWADQCTITPYNPLANSTQSQRNPWPGPGDAPPNWNYDYPPRVRSADPNINSPFYTVNYQMADVSIAFKPVNSPISADASETSNQNMWWVPGSPEYKRFVGPAIGDFLRPKIEIISAGGGATNQTLYFAEGSPGQASGPIPGGPAVAGTVPIPGGMTYIRKQSNEFNIAWELVEESYIVDATEDNYLIMPRPARLMAHLGTVNSDTFCGNPPGTLLLDGMTLNRFQQPIRTNSPFGLFAYDILLKFVQFDPPRSATVTTVPGSSTPLKRGHWLYPWREDNLWYYATKGTNAGKYTGTPQIRESRFADMFLHVKDPTAFPS